MPPCTWTRPPKREEQKVDKVIGELYDYYLNHVDRMSNFYIQLAYQEGRERAVTDLHQWHER